MENEKVLYIAEIPYETGEVHFRYSRRLSEDGTKWIRDGLFTEYYQNGNVASTGLYEMVWKMVNWRKKKFMSSDFFFLPGSQPWRLFDAHIGGDDHSLHLTCPLVYFCDFCVTHETLKWIKKLYALS